jgi:hypothetical protein
MMFHELLIGRLPRVIRGFLRSLVFLGVVRIRDAVCRMTGDTLYGYICPSYSQLTDLAGCNREG